ncbi:hypothetical protein MKEN_00791200 [Mycena kentingensis (nom. inval.)]|nr:hypothetical protein MKEN_00791200 [Mycena kentingensis (nom. inval.)]
MLRTITRSVASNARSFHYTAPAHKTVTEKVSEVADTVNKKVGKGLADAIGAGQEAAAKTKETLQSTSETVKDTTEKNAKAADQTLNQTTASARQAAEDVKKKATK